MKHFSPVNRKTTAHNFEKFEKIFNPQKIAIVGVSSKGTGFGSGILKSLLSIGFDGKIFPVNPKEGEIAGLRIYKCVAEIPDSIDFAIITVPAPHVPEALDECRKKGAAGAEILSAGFKEANTVEGSDLEKRLKEIASKGIRVIGPNCFGIYCPKSGLTYLPGPDLSRKPGPVAFISQSGGMSVDFANIGKWMGISFSKMISFGNGSDLRETELLKYFTEDEETQIISMYIEGVKNGRDFYNTLKNITNNKPVIIYKGGLSDSGKRAVESHTASMGGSSVIWKSLLTQCNAVSVSSLEELAKTTMAFTLLPKKRYNGVSVIGGGGALCVNACDAAELYGFELPVLSNSLQSVILDFLPKPGSSAKNPLDVANPFASVDIIKKALLLTATDARIDVQILIQLLYHYKSALSGNETISVKEITPFNKLAEAVSEVVIETKKPVVMVLPNNKKEIEAMDIEDMMREARDIFLKKSIPVFETIDDALKSIRHIADYSSKNLKRIAKNSTKTSFE